MMRLFLITGLLTFLMSSCVVMEDVTFAENGTVKYQLAIDMSQLSQTGGSSEMHGMPSEAVSIAELMKDSIANLDKLTAEQKQILQDLSPFYMKAHSEDEEEEYTFKIYGEFKNIDEFNKALVALERTKELEKLIQKDSAEPNAAEGFSPVGKLSNFVWNGKQMQRIYTKSDLPKVVNEGNAEMELDDSLVGTMAQQMAKPMLQMLEMGQYITKYHFPKTIKASNIESGEISEDGKTLTITQMGLHFIEPEFDKTVIDLK